jgi:hypothetical protein
VRRVSRSLELLPLQHGARLASSVDQQFLKIAIELRLAADELHLAAAERAGLNSYSNGRTADCIDC